MTITDGLLVSAAGFVFVGLVLGIAELSLRSGVLGPDATRGLVHCAVGVAAGLLPIWFKSPAPFYPVAVVALGVTWLDSSRGRLRSVHSVQRQTSGTVTFAAAFLLAAVLCWDLVQNRTYAFSASMLVLAVADPLAAIVGRHRQSTKGAASEPKSIEGSIAFCFASVCVVSTVLAVGKVPAYPSLTFTVLAVLLCATAASAAEHVATRGYDNLAIVGAVCATLHLVSLPTTTYATLVIALSVPAAFAYAAFRARLLNGSGAVVAGLLAATIIVMWDWMWVVPGLMFFAAASGMSRVGRARKRLHERRLSKGSVRDPAQVLANGGVSWLMLLCAAFLPGDLWFWGFAGAFAAAAADTLATEVGMLAKSRPRDIRTWRRVSPGSSGAVSAQGTAAGLLGALLIAGSTVPFISVAPDQWIAPLVALTTAGFIGSAVDTLLGAYVQALYVDADGEATERRNGNRLVRGRSWLNNDVVNGLSAAVGAIVAAGWALAILP